MQEQTHIWTDRSAYELLSQLKTRALYLSWFNYGGPKKFNITFFQWQNWDFHWFLQIFYKIPDFSKESQGTSEKAKGLLYWILAVHIHIYAPLKIELAKHPCWIVSKIYCSNQDLVFPSWTHLTSVMCFFSGAGRRGSILWFLIHWLAKLCFNQPLEPNTHILTSCSNSPLH